MTTEIKPATSVTESQIDRSFKERFGDRYYEVDHSYDKRVYENTVGNYIRIIFTLIFFWLFQAIHWWGIFELGVNYTTYLMWYSIAIFIFTILIGACLLFSGKYANKKKRLHTFITDKIAEEKSKQKDKKAKEDAAKAVAAKAMEAENAAANYAINSDSRI